MRTIRAIRLSHCMTYLTVLAVLFGGVGQVQAGDYLFTIIAETGDTIGGKILTDVSGVGISNNDHIAFTGKFLDDPPGPIQQGIFTKDELLHRTGDTIGGQTLTSMGNPRFNASGDYVWNSQTNITGGKGTEFAVIGGVPEITASGNETIDGLGLKAVGGSYIMNNGDVGFTAALGAFPAGGFAILKKERSSGTKSFLLKPEETIDGKTLTVTQIATDPIINNNDVAGVVANFAGGKGLFNITQGLLLAQVGDLIDGITLTDIRNTGLNDTDEFVFLAHFTGGEALISTQRGVLAKTGIPLDGKILGTIGKPRLTDSGEVIFVAGFDPSGRGLFSTERGFIIGNGDDVDGRTLNDIGEEQVNDNGVVAFSGTLDGQRAIILATPVLDLPDPDHFKCYNIRGQATQTSVDLSDQFEDENGAQVVRPVILCAPVNKNKEGFATPDGKQGPHLVCYRTRRPRGQPRLERRQVVVDNQFGKQTVTVMNRTNLLCVPSSKTELP